MAESRHEIMQRKPVRRLSYFRTHMARAPDDSMVYRFRKGD